MAVSLSKNDGHPLFIVKAGKEKGKKYKLDLDYRDGPPVKEYKKGQIQLVPNGKHRECHIIFGPSGSGKSYWANNYMKEYKRKFKKRAIYLISPKDEDDSLDERYINRLKMKAKNWIEDPIPLEELEDSLVVFDDCEAIGDREVKMAVDKLKDGILLQGRSKNISCIIICHMLMNYKETRIQNSESHTLTFFPSAGSTYQLREFLSKHCGLSKAQIDEILKMPSRHVTLHKCYPMWLMTCDYFKLL
jgi:hypothetical protein